ncbi:MAG: hypothetical protein ACI808_002450, partial [Paraglaciecola sp.]
GYSDGFVVELIPSKMLIDLVPERMRVNLP